MRWQNAQTVFGPKALTQNFSRRKALTQNFSNAEVPSLSVLDMSGMHVVAPHMLKLQIILAEGGAVGGDGDNHTAAITMKGNTAVYEDVSRKLLVLRLSRARR